VVVSAGSGERAALSAQNVPVDEAKRAQYAEGKKWRTMCAILLPGTITYGI
jgi:hypothetical protein